MFWVLYIPHSFSADHEISEPYLVQHLASLRHPYHIQESETAQRWRRERYVIRISERAKNLLMTWLQTESLGGDTDESRAKDRMTSTINEKVRVECK
jgi:transcription initiation factor TFIID subunit 5